MGQISSERNQQDGDDAEGRAGAPTERALHIKINAVSDRPELDARNQHDRRGELDAGRDERDQPAGDQPAANHRQRDAHERAQAIGAKILRRLFETDVNLLQRGVTGAHGVRQPAHAVGDHKDQPRGSQRRAKSGEVPAVKYAQVADREDDAGDCQRQGGDGIEQVLPRHASSEQQESDGRAEDNIERRGQERIDERVDHEMGHAKEYLLIIPQRISRRQQCEAPDFTERQQRDANMGQQTNG